MTVIEPGQTPEPTDLVELIDGAIRTNMLMGLQDAELFDEPGRERINDWADWISENAAKAVQAEVDRRLAARDAEVLLAEAADLKARCLVHNDDIPAGFMDCPCGVAEELIRKAKGQSRG